MAVRSIPIHVLSADDFEDENTVPKLVKMVLLLATKDGASEILFEPQESSYRLRYQVAGKWYDMVPPPEHLGRRIAQVFKVMADLDICNARSPQEGRMRFALADGEAEMLVSIQPSPHGEAVRVSIVTNSMEKAAKELLDAYLSRGSYPPAEDERSDTT
jgi:type IV pilus assembly protein PilB